jgi:hypothetical protein
MPFWVQAYPVRTEDEIDLMLQRGWVPPAMIQSHILRLH